MTRPRVRPALSFVGGSAMRLASSGLQLALIAFMARHWGPSRVGEYAMVLSAFEFLRQFPLIGLHQQIGRDIGARPGSAPRIVTNALPIGLGVALLLSIALGIFGTFAQGGRLSVPFWLVGASLFPTGFINLAEAALVGQGRYFWVSRTSIIENVGRFGSGMLCVALDANLWVLFAAFLAFRIVNVTLHLTQSRIGRLLAWRLLSFRHMTTSLREAPVFSGILTLSAANDRIDFIMLTVLSTATQMGLYLSAYKLFDFMLMAPTIAALVLYPAISGAFARDREHFDAMIRAAVMLTFVVGVPAVLLVVALSSDILGLLYGFHSRFLQAVPVLQMLSVASLFLALDKMLAAAFVAARRQKQDLMVLTVSCGIYVILLVALIPHFGCIGAALATLAAPAVQLFVRLILINRFVSLADAIWPLTVVFIAAASAVAGGYGAAHLATFAAIPAGICIYLLLMMTFRAVSLSSTKEWIQLLSS